MSTTEQDGPTWFLARDGQQYGPITSAEMKKIIELGQLADTDLVWNETLTEWAPAQVAIDALSPPAPAPRPASELPPPPQPAPPAPQPSDSTRYDTASRQESEPTRGRTEPSSATDGTYRETYRDPRGADAYGATADAGAAHQHGDPSSHDRYDPYASRGRRETYADPRAGQPRPEPRPEPRANTVAPEPHRRDVAVDDRFDDDDDGDNSGSVALKAIAAGLLIALIGGGGWLAYQNRASLMAMVDQNGANAANTPVVRANETTGGANTPALRTTSTTTSSINRSQANGRAAFLDTAAWKSVATTFPEWAGEREQQAQSMLQSGQSQADVRKHLIDELAKLRRRHANDALSASPTALRSVATAFLTNLRTLTGRSPKICYEFISKGETSAQILPLLDDAEAGEPLLKQMHTVVQAIANGRETPQTYLPPRQSDYSMISTELSKMGWTGADMRLFGDPQKLAAAEPEKVCQLVTDWFTAQLMISDQTIQSRLLVQSLRPVVAG
jgi:hypothetical protein